jgi:pyruvate formate-lyase/glycerol dehydratase family glycyl radical enzyme
MEFLERLNEIKSDIFKKRFPSGWQQIKKITEEAYYLFKDEPANILRAKIFQLVLENIDIDIEDNQLIVGSIEPAFCGSYDLYEDSQLFLKEAEGRDFKVIQKNDPFNLELEKVLEEKEKVIAEEMLVIGKKVTGHAIPDFLMVLGKGLSGIVEEINELKKKTKEVNEINFYEACEISCLAVMDFARRYSELAAEKALNENNPRRKKELERISEICLKVPKYPATNFHEALQSFWFIYTAMHIEQFPNPYAFSVGRFDQFMFPYMQYDLQSGKIKRDDILELLGCLWLKFIFSRHIWAVSQNIILGGKLPGDLDACNYLTELCLEITEILKLPQPSVSFRYFNSVNKKAFKKALELVRAGIGMPSFFNDGSIIPALESEGIKKEDALDYAIAGCQEPFIPGKENARTTGGKFNLVKCLELTLNEGKSFLTDKQLGVITPVVEQIKSFDEFYNNFLQQLDYLLGIMVSAHNKSDYLLSEIKPLPFYSCLVHNCLEKGIDFRANGAIYNSTGVLVHGLGTTADSLAAIKKVVFTDKKMNFRKFTEILKDNFKFDEEFRLYLDNKISKFGNNDNYVDEIASKLFSDFTDILSKYRNYFGGKFRAGFNSPSTHIQYGAVTAATPDGRKEGQPFSYGTGPGQGKCMDGPTSIILSLAKLSQQKATLGTDISLSFDPLSVSTEEKLEKLGALIKSYFYLGGHHLMFNIVDAEILKKAQKNPGNFKDLIVRVHGYSSFFNSLSKDIQDELIERVKCGL